MYSNETERHRALRYSRLREWLAVVDLIWNVALLALALTTGLSTRLRDRAARLAPKRLGPAIPYAALAIIASSLLSFPLSFFGGYVVEHRYGLSNQSKRAWLVDSLKGLGISVALGAPLVGGMTWIMRRYPRRWWAVLSGLTIPFSILLSNLAPILLMPLFNKFEPIKDKALEKRIKDLAEGEGVHISAVMQMDMSRQTKKANAFFTGVGNTKRIVLGDTLLDEFTPDEVEVVLAHELGHQVHRDLWKLIGLQVLVTLGTFYAMQRIAPAMKRRFGSRWGMNPDESLDDVAVLPLLGLIGTGASTMLVPAINAVIRNWVEHPADRYALDLTGKPAAFVGAMEKLGRMNLSNPSPSRLVKWVFHTHPTVQERIDYGRHYKPTSNP